MSYGSGSAGVGTEGERALHGEFFVTAPTAMRASRTSIWVSMRREAVGVGSVQVEALREVSAVDFALWEGLLKFGDARACHLGEVEVQGP
jgi:hypothetical protein